MTIDIEFTDYYRLTKPNEQQISEWKDYMGSGFNPGAAQRGLRVVMEATHAGIINDNDRFYIPSRMAEGVATFRTGEKPTKLLKHHDPHSDPVGIVRGARFVPTVPDELRDNIDVQTLMSSSAPIKDQLKSVRNLWRAGLLHSDGWRGLGYIELIGDVFDEKTIEQVNNGLFDAVSTNFRSPGAAHCLICGQNWAADGFCEHEWGEMYTEDGDDEDEGFKFPAMAIPGVHDYLETSFVTFEGDALATVKVMDRGNEDNNKTVFLPDNFSWGEDNLNSTEPRFEFKDFKEGNMPGNQNENTLSDAEQKVFDIIKKFREEVEDEVLAELAKKITAMVGEDGLLPDQEEAEIDDETAILYAMEDLETEGQEIDDAKIEEIEALYQEEFVKLHDEKLISDEELEDAKLSTKKRKSLPESSFCGPNRSFPVPDCAHVTAARRLIGRYKGPGSKTRILACVSRKAKAMGCGEGSKKDENNNTPDANVNVLPCVEDSLKDMNDSELRNLYMAAELQLVDRGQKMAFECKECALHEEKVEKATEELSKAQADNAKLENTLSVLRHEYARLQTEYMEQVDRHVELSAGIHAEQVEKFALIGVLSGKYDSIENAKDAMKAQDVKKLEVSFADFDVDAASKKLNDGMAKEPEGTVDDPTTHIDGDNIQLMDGLSGPAIEAAKNIKELISDGKISDAQHIYATMKSVKLFPDELTFESFSAETNTAD